MNYNLQLNYIESSLLRLALDKKLYDKMKKERTVSKWVVLDPSVCSRLKDLTSNGFEFYILAALYVIWKRRKMISCYIILCPICQLCFELWKTFHFPNLIMQDYVKENPMACSFVSHPSEKKDAFFSNCIWWNFPIGYWRRNPIIS